MCKEVAISGQFLIRCLPYLTIECPITVEPRLFEPHGSHTIRSGNRGVQIDKEAEIHRIWFTEWVITEELLF